MLGVVGQHLVQVSSYSPQILSQNVRGSNILSSVTFYHLQLSLNHMKWGKSKLAGDVGRLV